MCELMAICSNMEVNPRFSFKEIKIRGGDKGAHRDGWGIGFYQEGAANIIKEALPAYKSQKARAIEDGTIKLNSKIFVTHIRWSSAGEVSPQNAHPFKRTLFNKDWIFAHNGTVRGIFNEKLNHFKPVGETDSEYAFCFILDKLKEKCKENSSTADFRKVIEETANQIKELGKFNCILSDSEYVYAFGDNSLCFTIRTKVAKSLTLKDADYTINVSDMKRTGEKAVIIATMPLTTEEEWTKFKGLKIFKDGEEIHTKKH